MRRERGVGRGTCNRESTHQLRIVDGKERYSVTLGADAVATSIYNGSVAALQAIWSADSANQCSVVRRSFTCEKQFSDWITTGGPSGISAGVQIVGNNAWQIDWVEAVNGDEANKILIDSALTELINEGTGAGVDGIVPSPYNKAVDKIVSTAFGLVIDPTYTPASYTTESSCSPFVRPPSEQTGGKSIVV